ncbi:MAG TPA: ribosome assembly cofactor RimP, partial [Prochlorococcaceae cyanobacterium AMR_MDS_5431]|nr:ribosome assembly cofactor RimP [Prochlorococcaceae cyanobacterium AMR_MDS_5431]
MVSSVVALIRQISDLTGKIVHNIKLSNNLTPTVLQVQISTVTKEPISIDDCVIFSRQLEEALDNISLLTEPYILEVGSPGITEELLSDKDFVSFRGFPIEIIFSRGNGSTNRRQGLLLERDEQSVLLNIRGRIYRI